MTLGIPAKFAPILLASALSRQLFVYAAASILTAQLALLAMGIDGRAPSVIWAAVLLSLPGLVLVVITFWRPHPGLAALYLALMGGGLWLVADAALLSVPHVPSTALAPFALLSIAMTLVSGVAFSVAGRVMWALVGFVTSTLVLWAAATASQGEFRPDARSVLGALVIIGIAFIVPGQSTLTAKAQQTFDASLTQIEQDGEQASAGREAVARLHDTLLADLTVVTRIRPGPLSSELRENLEVELAHLVSTDWLVEEIDKGRERKREPESHSGPSEAFMEVIDSYLSRGLTVNVSGDLSALDPLTPESIEALLGAVGQCLSNVMAHSGILTVDVVVLASGDAATVTVIDGGIGFEPDAVDVDRLGLRVSVRSRIESVGGFVKIWSIPGQGTAIMLQVPFGGRE